MGSNYYLSNKKCPYCDSGVGEITYSTALEDYNAEGEYMGNYGICPVCRKRYNIVMEFVLEKTNE
jgi:hypothetical protein